MVDIEMLQALHGDAFILHCQKNGNDGVIVVDGGPNRDSRKIVSQLDALETIGKRKPQYLYHDQLIDYNDKVDIKRFYKDEPMDL